MKITFNGFDDILDTIDGIIDVNNLEQAMKKAVLTVEREAKMNAPRGTGDLARSITSKVETNGNEVIGTVFTPLEYAPYVEYGTGLFAEAGDGRKDVPWNYQDDEGNWHSTSGQHPQPFMRPALDENREQILKILAEGVIND
jgi:HK97 gp10 family phage protein